MVYTSIDHLQQSMTSNTSATRNQKNELAAYEALHNTGQFIENLVKFKLMKNSKLPSHEWCKRNQHMYMWSKTKHNAGNWGLLCGKVNGTMGVNVDLYKWDSNSKFAREVMKNKSWDEYMKGVDTLTISTPNGGYHLHFKLTDLPQINCGKHGIDVKGEGGHLVGPGSEVFKKDGVTMGECTVAHHCAVKEMPTELYDWLHSNLSYKHNVNNPAASGSAKEPKQQKSAEVAAGSYNHDFTDEHVLHILDNLPTSYMYMYVTKHDDWLKTATSMKAIGEMELFLECWLNHPGTRVSEKGDSEHNRNVSLMNRITKHNA